MTRIVRTAIALLAMALALTAAPACSLKKIAINSVANTLAESGATFASDDDPDLIRDAVPFSLKLVESLLAEAPKHGGLLLTACSGFTQYAYAFVDADAAMLKLDDYTAHAKLQDRARKMYLRGRDYCLRGLELRSPGITRRLSQDPDKAVAALQKKDVPFLYWTGASWGKAVALSLDRPALAGDFPIVQALVRRALALDESFNAGAIHDVMITLESLPRDLGGDRARARVHYERALALTNGNAAGPHVSYAIAVLLPEQKREEFVALITKALEVDVDREPRLRLANVLAQQYARYLLEHLDELFLEDKEGHVTLRSSTAVLAALVGTAGALDAQGALKIATMAPDNSVYVKALREMADAWKKRTNGRVIAHVHPGGDQTEEGMLRNMRPNFRKLQAAQLSAITLGNVEPAFNVFGLPMFYESYAEADRVLEALAPELEKRLEAKGYKALNFAYAGWVHVFSKKPVSRVDDLRKLPMYTSTGDDRMARWYSAHGFKAVPLDPTSMLASLRTGMIEAVPAPPLFAQLLTWYRSAPFMMDLGFAPLLGATVMSLDTWTKISSEDQRVIAEEAKKAGERLRREVPRLETEAIEAMKKSGLMVTKADQEDWRRMAEGMAGAMRSAGLVPGNVYEIARRERDLVRAAR